MPNRRCPTPGARAKAEAQFRERQQPDAPVIEAAREIVATAVAYDAERVRQAIVKRVREMRDRAVTPQSRIVAEMVAQEIETMSLTEEGKDAE